MLLREKVSYTAVSLDLLPQESNTETLSYSHRNSMYATPNFSTDLRRKNQQPIL